MKLSWTRFNKYLYKYWKLQAIVILLELILALSKLLNPYLAKLVIDDAYRNRDLRLFFILALISGSIFVINDLIDSLGSYLSKRINCYVHFDMTKDFFRHLQYLPLSFSDEHSTGEHIYRVIRDVDSVSRFVCDTIPKMVKLFPRLLFILVIVFFLNWRLALLVSFLVPLTYLYPVRFRKWLKGMNQQGTLVAQEIFKRLQETFSHTRLIKALGRGEYEIGRFEKNLTENLEYELKKTKVSTINSFSNSVINNLLNGVVALYGGYQMMKGTMTLGSLTAIMLYLNQLIGLLSSIGNLYRSIVMSSVTHQRVTEILDIDAVVDTTDAITYVIREGKIEFKDVFFGYNKDRAVLKGISFSVEPAGKVALVGLSGCGKTTILSLILRLYELEKGAILIDGVDTKKIKLTSLRSQIGIALQEPFLWSDTIANNILYGAEGQTYKDVVWAAELAEAHGFIMKFPNGYDSVIGEMACKISVGQKQRIAVARALIKRPKILILDEATSSLDSETEDKVMDNIVREFKDSTMIVVSHRASTIKKMDLAYFLEYGSIVKNSFHKELLDIDSRYSQIFTNQSGVAYSR